MTEQGKQYASFIEAELKAENDRRSSINTRAAAALTGAAGLVTVVLAVFAVLVGKDLTLTASARSRLVVAMMALLGAGLFAVLAGLPWRYKATKPATLLYFLEQSWGDTEVTARGRTAYCNVVVVKSLRRGNVIKSALLVAAATCQAVAIFALVLCTIAVV